jgi:hypothetical protein
MDEHSLEPLLSADAVRAISASGQRTMTRRSLRTHQGSRINKDYPTSRGISSSLNNTASITTGMNNNYNNAAINNIMSIDTSSLVRSEAKVRIAPAYGSLEAFLESFTFFDDDTITMEEAIQRAQRDAYVLNRADQVTNLSAPSPRTIFPIVPGPDESYRSMLLALIKTRLKAIRWQRQRHSHLRGLICRAIERYFEDKHSREERERQGEEKRRRQLARQAATMIRKYWKTFEQVIITIMVITYYIYFTNLHE